MKHPPQIKTQQANKSMPLWAYVDGKKRNIGYAYLTQNGSLCIRGNKLLDKSQLGKMLISGVYVFLDNQD